MKNLLPIGRTVLLLAVLCLAAFGLGWWTSAKTSVGVKRKQIPTAGGSLYCPPGLSIAMVSRNLSNQDFVPGDRVDVLIKHHGRWEPLIIDALVAMEDWQTIALIVFPEEAVLLRQARGIDRDFRYRFTLAPE